MSNRNLDLPITEFENWLKKATKLVIDKYSEIDTAKAFSGLTPLETEALFNDELPFEGIPFDEVLRETKEKVLDNATMNIAPNMYAYVMAGGTQASVVADLLASAINQNGAKWHLSPCLTELEKRVIKWGAEFMGYSANAAGSLTSGGSAANLMCLDIAKRAILGKEIRKAGLFGMRPAVVYASTEVHGCIDKSMEHLGLGTDFLRKIPVDNNFRINIDILLEQINKDIESGVRPFCVVGNAGTVNTGAVDPLLELARIAKVYNMWFHVDGAYGCLAASLPENKKLFAGMEKADSIAVDFHKFLYQPFEAGCAMVKNWEVLSQTYQHQASYLKTDDTGDQRMDLNDYSFPLSRNFKALKIWMSFKTYGSDRLSDAIRNDIENASYLASMVSSSDQFELCSGPMLSITCFRYLGPNEMTNNSKFVDQINREIIPALEKDGRVFITGTIINGRPVIRACCINHRMEKSNIDFLLQVIQEVGLEVEQSLTHVNS